MLSCHASTKSVYVQSYLTLTFSQKRWGCFLGVTDAFELLLSGSGLQSYVLLRDIDALVVLELPLGTVPRYGCLWLDFCQARKVFGAAAHLLTVFASKSFLFTN